MPHDERTSLPPNTTARSRPRHPQQEVADLLATVQNDHDGVQVGSYPFWRHGRGGANFVLRSVDDEQLDAAVTALKQGLEAMGVTAQEGEI